MNAIGDRALEPDDLAWLELFAKRTKSGRRPFGDYLKMAAMLPALLDAARAEGPVQGACPVCQHLAGGKCLGAPECPMAVTPPADEVGRAVERLQEGLDDFAHDFNDAGVLGERWEAVVEVSCDDLSLILSHVSRIEGLLRYANEQQEAEWFRAEKAEASLKLAVEALEKIAEQPNLTMSNGKAASWMFKIVKTALSSLRPSVSAPGGDVEASRQSGDEG